MFTAGSVLVCNRAVWARLPFGRACWFWFSERNDLQPRRAHSRGFLISGCSWGGLPSGNIAACHQRCLT